MAGEFTLTRAERYVLANQYRILALLEPSQAEEHNRLREALEHGYAREYEPVWIVSDDEVITRAEADFVHGVMGMFTDLLRFCEAHGGPPNGVAERDVTFFGFDGNNETTYMAYARYLVADGHSYERILRRVNPDLESARRRVDLFNSHMPTLWRYRPMLDVYRRVITQPPVGELSLDQFLEVVAAGRGAEGGDPTR